MNFIKNKNKSYTYIYTSLLILFIILSLYFITKTYLNFNIYNKKITEELKEDQSILNDKILNSINSTLTPNINLINSLKVNIEKTENFDPNSLKENIKSQKTLNNFSGDVRFYDNKLHKITTSEDVYTPIEKNFNFKMDSSDKIHITPPNTDKISLEKYITISVPVKDKEEVRGLLSTDIYIGGLALSNKYSNFNLELKTYIIDDSGRIISSSSKVEIDTTFKDIFYNNSIKEAGLSPSNASKQLSLLDEINTKNEGYIYINNFYNNEDPILIGYKTVPTLNWKVVTYNNSIFFKDISTIQHSKMVSENLIIVLALILLLASIIMILLLLKNQKLKQTLYKDMLTGLPNRYFIEQSINSIKSYNNTFIIFIDMDNFKCFYKTMPHEDTDHIIKIFASYINSTLENSKQKLGRIERTKFCLLVEGMSLREVLKLTDYIYKTLSNKHITFGDYNFDINVNIGISHIKETENPSASFSLAEMALNKASENHQDKIVYLSPGDLDKNIREIHKMNKVNSSLKYALDNDKLLLYLQPIMDIKKGSISHYEGLVRIIDETGSFLSPSDFIPVAEKYGIVSRIDKWVFNRAISFIKERPDIKISINFSAVTLSDTEVLKYFEDELISLRLARIPINLGIEITETAAIKNLELVKKWMNIFKSLGCTIALDDFGVGYTSLSYLGSLPVDFVKIDGCFIRSIIKDKGQMSIVKAIKMVSETFNKKTVAEYVEDKEILEKLSELNIDYAQGYYIGKPFPSLDIDKQEFTLE